MTDDFANVLPAGIQNPRIKQYLAIKKNTKSNPDNLACLEGLWELSKALDAKLELRAFFVCPELLRGDTGVHMAKRMLATGVHAYQVSAKVMQRMVDRDQPDGLAAIVQLPHRTWDAIPLRDQNRVIVLDGIEIPGNVGTIIRCADATGADAIILTNRRTRLSHPKLIHSSMGSSFTVPVIEADVEETIMWLQQHDFRIFTTDTDAPLSYRAVDYKGRVAAVLGSERYGIVQEWYAAQDWSVHIPMSGQIDSLNVGNAAVLILYEMFYQQSPTQF